MELYPRRSGELINPAEVLTKTQIARLEQARHSDKTVYIRTPEETSDPASRPKQTGTLTWHFRMDHTRDVVFTASPTLSGTLRVSTFRRNRATAMPPKIRYLLAKFLSQCPCTPLRVSARRAGPALDRISQRRRRKLFSPLVSLPLAGGHQCCRFLDGNGVSRYRLRWHRRSEQRALLDHRPRDWP